jgi:tryptophan-rich sensory protein
VPEGVPVAVQAVLAEQVSDRVALRELGRPPESPPPPVGRLEEVLRNGLGVFSAEWLRQGPALRLFVVQWLLNALWTPLFFGLHQTGLALAEILLLWVMIGLTVRTFWKIKPAAGMLLLPYLGWVTFAAFLNFTLWRMNP